MNVEVFQDLLSFPEIVLLAPSNIIILGLGDSFASKSVEVLRRGGPFALWVISASDGSASLFCFMKVLALETKFSAQPFLYQSFVNGGSARFCLLILWWVCRVVCHTTAGRCSQLPLRLWLRPRWGSCTALWGAFDSRMWSNQKCSRFCDTLGTCFYSSKFLIWFIFWCHVLTNFLIVCQRLDKQPVLDNKSWTVGTRAHPSRDSHFVLPGVFVWLRTFPQLFLSFPLVLNICFELG